MPIYINKNSKHPPSILEELPKFIEKVYKKHHQAKTCRQILKLYQDTLKKSGLSNDLRKITTMKSIAHESLNEK